MKKQIGSYAVAWVALVGLFNIVCFVVPVDDRFSPNFWTGYGLVTAAFILHFIYAYKALSDDNAR